MGANSELHHHSLPLFHSDFSYGWKFCGGRSNWQQFHNTCPAVESSEGFPVVCIFFRGTSCESCSSFQFLEPQLLARVLLKLRLIGTLMERKVFSFSMFFGSLIFLG